MQNELIYSPRFARSSQKTSQKTPRARVDSESSYLSQNTEGTEEVTDYQYEGEIDDVLALLDESQSSIEKFQEDWIKQQNGEKPEYRARLDALYRQTQSINSVLSVREAQIEHLIEDLDVKMSHFTDNLEKDIKEFSNF